MGTSFLDFLRAFTLGWFESMSGGLSIPLAIAAVLFPSGPLKALLATTAAIAFVLSAYLVWRRERGARTADGGGNRHSRIATKFPFQMDAEDDVILVRKGDAESRIDLPLHPITLKEYTISDATDRKEPRPITIYWRGEIIGAVVGDGWAWKGLYDGGNWRHLGP